MYSQLARKFWHKDGSLTSQLTNVILSETSGNRTDSSTSFQDDSFVQSNNFIKKAGFTLAEVLLVITIIGIVASSTIPGLITSVQDMQYKAMWRKSYSQLSQSTNNIKEDNGGTMVNFFTNMSGGTGDRALQFPTIYSRYLTAIKKCNTYGTNVGGCWHQPFNWFDLAGTPQSNNNVFNIGFGLILADGSLLATYSYLDACTSNNAGVEDCGLVMVDTNGFKGPNMIGKDIYGAHLTKYGLLPWGLSPGAGNGVPITINGDTFYYRSNCSANDVPPHGGTQRGWACGVQNLLK